MIGMFRKTMCLSISHWDGSQGGGTKSCSVSVPLLSLTDLIRHIWAFKKPPVIGCGRLYQQAVWDYYNPLIGMFTNQPIIRATVSMRYSSYTTSSAENTLFWLSKLRVLRTWKEPEERQRGLEMRKQGMLHRSKDHLLVPCRSVHTSALNGATAWSSEL